MTSIFLHGYGSTPNSFRSKLLKAGYNLPQHSIFPSGTEEDHLFGGRRWFPLSQNDEDMRSSLLDPVSQIEQLVSKSSTDHRQIELVGYSQGGMIALEIANRGLVRIDKVITYASYLPVPTPPQKSRSTFCTSIEMFSSAGDFFISNIKVKNSSLYFRSEKFPSVKHYEASNLAHDLNQDWLNKDLFFESPKSTVE